MPRILPLLAVLLLAGCATEVTPPGGSGSPTQDAGSTDGTTLSTPAATGEGAAPQSPADEAWPPAGMALLSLALPPAGFGAPSFYLIGPSFPEGGWAEGAGWRTRHEGEWPQPLTSRIEGPVLPGSYIVRGYASDAPRIYRGSAEVDVGAGETVRVDIVPATPSIESVTVEPREAAQGEPLTMRLRVRGGPEVPLEVAARAAILGLTANGGFAELAPGETSEQHVTFAAPAPPGASPVVQHVALRPYLVGRLPWGEEVVATFSETRVALTAGPDVARLFVEAHGRPEGVRTPALVRVLDAEGAFVAEEAVYVGTVVGDRASDATFDLLPGVYRVELWAPDAIGAFWGASQVTLGPDERRSLALVRGTPYIVDVTMSPDVPSSPAGAPVTFDVMLRNYDDVEVEVRVALKIDREGSRMPPHDHEETKTLLLPPGGEASTSFTFTPREGGWHYPSVDARVQVTGAWTRTSFHDQVSAFEVAE